VNPRALAAWSAAGLVIALGSGNPVQRATVLAAALAVLLATAKHRRPIRPLLGGLALFVLASGLLNALLAHVGADVLAELPGWLPGLGGPITVEAFAGGLAAGLGLAAAVLAVAPLSLSQEPHELVDALPSALNRTGSALAASFNLVPAVARSFTAVREAQLMRGWRPRGPGSWGELVVPVVLTTIEDSIQLAESMEARAFGSGRRTHYAISTWSRLDALIIGGAAAAAAVFVAARLTGAAPDWDPYPVLHAPVTSPIALISCLPLVLPLAARWR